VWEVLSVIWGGEGGGVRKKTRENGGAHGGREGQGWVGDEERSNAIRGGGFPGRRWGIRGVLKRVGGLEWKEQQRGGED